MADLTQLFQSIAQFQYSSHKRPEREEKEEERCLGNADGPAGLWPLRAHVGFTFSGKYLPPSLAEAKWRFFTSCLSTGVGLNGSESLALGGAGREPGG